MGLFGRRNQRTMECAYGCVIPYGESYVAVTYSRERWDGDAVTVDTCAIALLVCMQHAPAFAGVIAALQTAGIAA